MKIMKKIIDNEKFLYASFSAIFVLFLGAAILVYGKPGSLPVPIFGALIGVIITALVTFILLNGQTKREIQKEIDSKKFEEKLKTYQTFFKKLCEIVKQEERVKEEDIKELIFQISLVSMHIEGTSVQNLFDTISKIIEDKNNENQEETDNQKSDKATKLTELTTHVLSVITILQEELHKDIFKGGLRQELETEKVKDAIANLAMTFFEMQKHKVPDAIPPEKQNIENIASITEKFHKELEVRLNESLNSSNNEDYSFEFYGDNNHPNFIITNNKWGKDYFVQLCYDNVDKLYIAIHGGDANNYREMYMYMRYRWGGYFNKWNWYKSLDKPYYEWVHTSEGRDIFENLNEKMLSDICKLLIEKTDYYNNYCKTVALRDEKIKKLDDISEVKIFYDRELYREYKRSDNSKDDIVVSTVLQENNQWVIRLFNRQYDYKITEKLFPEIIKNMNLVDHETESVKEYVTKLYNDNEIAEAFVKFSKEIKKTIKSL